MPDPVKTIPRMNRRTKLPLVSILLAAAAGVAIAAPPPALTVECDDADGIVDVGQQVTWTIRAQPGVTGARYTLKRGGLTEVVASPLDFESTQVATVTAAGDAPGTLLLDVRGTNPEGGDAKALGGVAIAPDKIEPSAPRPDDFDAFWAEKLAELAAVPINAQVVDVEPSTRPAPTTSTSQPAAMPGVTYSQVTLDNVRDTRVHGQLARPRTGEKFPALLVVQWAGLYPLQPNWVRDRAAEGWLAFNIHAHDLPIDQPEAFYKQQDGGPLKGYASMGNDDRDKSYFLRMYLGVARAIDYLKTRPDWDGKTIVVTGTSQGGLQAFVGAALRPDDVTAILAIVPAGADMLGADVGRSPGWPRWARAVGKKDKDAVRNASRYYDIVNFAPRVRCPALVGLGLLDETCPPAGVYAAANRLAGPKEIVAMPRSSHYGPHDPVTARAAAWRAAIRDGKPAPVDGK